MILREQLFLNIEMSVHLKLSCEFNLRNMTYHSEISLLIVIEHWVKSWVCDVQLEQINSDFNNF